MDIAPPAHAYAHVSEDGTRTQTVYEHLHNTAVLAAGFGKAFGAAEQAYLAGMLHDIGKYSAAFQRRLAGSAERVDHSTAGAKEAFARRQPEVAFCRCGASCRPARRRQSARYRRPDHSDRPGTSSGRSLRPLAYRDVIAHGFSAGWIASGFLYPRILYQNAVFLPGRRRLLGYRGLYERGAGPARRI